MPREANPPPEPVSTVRSLLGLLWNLVMACATLGALLVAGATLAGFAARWSPWGELACHFRVQYCLLLTLAVVALAIGRRFWRAGFFALFAGANLAVILPLYFGPAPVVGKTPLRVVSANLLAKNRDHGPALAFLRETKPDVAVLVEVNGAWAKDLQTLADEFPYSHFATRETNFGIAILSRLPLQGARTIEVPDGQCPAIVADVELQGKKLTIIAAHPYPPMGDSLIGIRNDQLHALAILAHEAAAGDSAGVVLLGDLNATSWSPAFGDFLEQSGLVDTRRGFGVQATWAPLQLQRLGLPLIPIDHCLVSPNLKTANRRVGPFLNSDHLPIIVDLE